MTLTTNQHPKPIDSRHVGNNTTPQGQELDPIRDEVIAKLKEAGIATYGKNDAALLADYTKMLRDQAATAKKQDDAATSKTATNAAHGEFAGYDMNKLMD